MEAKRDGDDNIITTQEPHLLKVPSSPILSPQAFCNISLLIFDRFSKTMCVLCTEFNDLSNAALHDFLFLFVQKLERYE